MPTLLRRALYVLAGLSWVFVGVMTWKALSYERVPNVVVVLLAIALAVAVVFSGACIAAAFIAQAAIIWRSGYRVGRADESGQKPNRLRIVKRDKMGD